MIVAALIAAAALLFGGQDVAAKIRELLGQIPAGAITRRHLGAVACLMAACFFYAQQKAAPGPTPPAPAPAGPLDLRGTFRGPTAAEDAATVGALCGELANEIAWDGEQPEPGLKSGVALDELRRRARELRCRGVSIGARQPAARDAIAAHLERAVGTSGGPITPEQRAAWIRALNEIAEACSDVTR